MSGMLAIESKLPIWVIGLVGSGSGGSGARNGTKKLRDGALRHREKKGVKYPRTTTVPQKNSQSSFDIIRTRTNQLDSNL
jgi:hypothetical protein